MRIATLNLQHGGGNRVKALCEALDQLDADVLVLTEFRSGPRGEELTAWLRARGYCAVTHSGADARTNSVLVAARVGAISPRPLSATSAHAHRVAELVVGETLVVGAYFPGSEIKDRFWRTEFLPYMTSRVARRCLVLGDFNTGKHFVDESGSTFFSADCIDTLERAGWVDPWRARNPMAREYTWFSNVGNGFRLDHAYASPTLAPEVLNAWYDHGPRESHVTDHSALVVELVRMIP